MKDPCLVKLALALNAIEERPTPEGWEGQSHDAWLRSWGSYFSQVRDALLDFSAEVLKESKMIIEGDLEKELLPNLRVFVNKEAVERGYVKLGKVMYVEYPGVLFVGRSVFRWMEALIRPVGSVDITFEMRFRGIPVRLKERLQDNEVVWEEDRALPNIRM